MARAAASAASAAAAGRREARLRACPCSLWNGPVEGAPRAEQGSPGGPGAGPGGPGPPRWWPPVVPASMVVLYDLSSRRYGDFFVVRGVRARSEKKSAAPRVRAPRVYY